MVETIKEETDNTLLSDNEETKSTLTRKLQEKRDIEEQLADEIFNKIAFEAPPIIEKSLSSFAPQGAAGFKKLEKVYVFGPQNRIGSLVMNGLPRFYGRRKNFSLFARLTMIAFFGLINSSSFLSSVSKRISELTSSM